MLEVVVDSDELDDRMRQLIEALTGSERDMVLLSVGGAVGGKIEEIVREYPDAPGRSLDAVYERKDAKGKTYYSKFKNRKAQLGFFKALKKGLIAIPYKRTGKLVQSLTHVSEIIGNGVKITAGSNMPYASKVIGEKRTGGVNGWKPGMQTTYHEKTGWKSLPNEVRTGKQVLAATAAKRLAKELSARLK